MKLHEPNEGGDDTLDDLIGHALELLEPDERLSVAHFATTDDSARRAGKIARLRSHLDTLLDDGHEPCGSIEMNPPEDLSQRTLERIRLREAVSLEFREPLPYQPRWRVADVAVAAAVLFATFLGSLSVIKDGKASAANLACSANLAQIWKGFEQYANVFNAFPNASVENRNLPVGATLALLRHTGHLDSSVPLTCPGCSSRIHAGELPSWNHLREQSEAMIDDFSSTIVNVYALHPGVRGRDGVRHLERSMIEAIRSVVPLAGDAPPMAEGHRVISGNSPFHGGFGQNVIFADGHTMFIRSRSLRSLDDDIYANRQGRCSAAIDPFDMILIPAAVRPFPD